MRASVINQTILPTISGTSVLVTPSAPPVAGNVLFILLGGNASRTITPPSGFTLVPRVSIGATVGLMWKVATGAEPADYTVNFSGTLDGGGTYFEIKDIDTSIAVESYGDESVGAVTSFNAGNFSVPTPGIVFSILAKSGTSAWTPSNDFVISATPGQCKVGRKIYAYYTNSDTVTWSGTSETVVMDNYFFHAKYVR